MDNWKQGDTLVRISKEDNEFDFEIDNKIVVVFHSMINRIIFDSVDSLVTVNYYNRKNYVKLDKPITKLLNNRRVR